MMFAGKLLPLLKSAGSQYVNNAALQDVAETLVGSAVAAGGQALFTDMTPEEIALSTGLGAGAAFIARPLGARLGAKVGRKLDAKYPNAATEFAEENADLVRMVAGTPQSVRQFQNMARQVPRDQRTARGAAEALKNTALAKYNQNFRDRGGIEGIMTYLSRYYADNVAQGAVALSTPLLVNRGGEVDQLVSDEALNRQAMNAV
jgi:hypothetical protein